MKKRSAPVRHLLSVIGPRGGLREELLRGSAGSLVLKATSMGLTSGLTILLARVMGPDGYGTYAYAFALLALLGIPAQFGLPQLVVRETARAETRREWDTIKAIWRWSLVAALAVSAAIAALSGIGAFLLSRYLDDVQLRTFAWGVVLIPIMSVGALRDAALRGLRRVVLGQIAETAVRPLAMIAMVLVAWASIGSVAPDLAMAIHVVAALVAFLVGATLLYRVMPAEIRASECARYRSREWLASTLPLALVAGMQIINARTDIVLLGLFASAETVGVYRVVIQTSLLVGFTLTALNQVVAPQFSRLYTDGELRRLQRLVTLNARIILAGALPVAALLIVFGDGLLTFVFGVEYAAGHWALIILALGQLTSAAFGSVGYLLNMTGHEEDTARGMLAATLTNVTLNLMLIPMYGIEGAAAATVASMFVWNALLHRKAKQRLNIESSAIGVRAQASKNT